MTRRALNALTLLLLIVGGINWALVGIFEFDMVTAIFGNGNHETAASSTVARIVYIVIGLAALWQMGELWRRIARR